ncbi:MAG TPA: TMEM175 family protein [Ignavibacteriaceae bacterium]|nr:TMEM175 family protein [Ignavibacteriaceae bacterium]
MKILPDKRITEVNRLETFSDAVFAFAATLLVVALEVPDSFQELVAELKGFIAFALSFTALILIWSVHNAIFRRYGVQDRTMIILNGCLLFVVLFYVYPLKFVSENLVKSFFKLSESGSGIKTLDDLSLLFELYSAGFVAVFLCISLMYRHIYKKFGDTFEKSEISSARFHFRHYMIFVLVGILSIILAWSGIGLIFGLPGFIYSLLGPLCYLHGKSARKKNMMSNPAG